MFDFLFKPVAAPEAVEDSILVHGRRVPLVLIRNPRARRYLLRLRPDGTARLTVPRRGTIAEARQFAARNTNWLAGQLEKLAQRLLPSREWHLGATLLFRGESTVLESVSSASDTVRLGSELIKVADATHDLRPAVTKHLWKLAARELPPRTFELAATHHLTVQRVSVRNQRTRWGSCSRRGVISLNWRLIQSPPSVSDYIILHELMHLRQMNHSSRYWREVASVCPDYSVAEKWLKQNSVLLK